MSPPVSSDLQRVVLPGGLQVDGDFFPQGAHIATNTYSLHHNESVFLDPFVYRPERWIADDKTDVSATDVARAETAFAPFSAGSRACVGKNLAYLELMITMGRLLHRMNVKVPQGNTVGEGAPGLMWGRRNEGQYQTADAFVVMKEGPIAQFQLCT